MSEIVRLDKPYWKSFRLTDGKIRWLYTDEKTALRIDNKEWFNKSTTGVIIYKGYETEEYSTEPISETIYQISICYQISNYFGDTSGLHFRNKIYVYVDGKLYKQENYKVVEVKRITKELKGILKELEHNFKNN